MKILLGNNTFDMLAGSETWMMTLADELLRLGHELTAYSPKLGFVSSKLEIAGVKCIREITDEKPDLVICAHYEITNYIHSKLPNVPIIAVVHGILHKESDTILPEHPVSFKENIKYIAVSEEVQSKLKNDYNIESVIVRNFFDLEKFKKTEDLAEKPNSFLINSNYWGSNDVISKTIKEVADHYKAETVMIGVETVPVYGVSDIIKDSDIVVGMGRSVMEGACMGKLAIVHGRWGTGGVITPESYQTLKLSNFSGRLNGKKVGLLKSEELIRQIDQYYNQKNINEVYKIIKKEHNVKIAAEQILNFL